MTAAPRDCLPAMRLDDLVAALPKGARVVGDGSVRVRGVRHDSRAVTAGDLFIARKGQNFDGARFVHDAVARGAAAIMACAGAVDPEATPVPLVVVDDPSSALAFAAHAVYGLPSDSLEVVGITGTNGKTTTAHLVRAAVDQSLGRPGCGVLGTIGNSFGTLHEEARNTTPEADDIARTLAGMRQRGATHVAMEVSSHGLALGRVEAIRFRVGALTNLTQDHLDFHGSMAAYAQAKARLFTDLRPDAAVLNVDDPLGRELVRKTAAMLVRVSARPGARATEADLAPYAARIDGHGIDMKVRTPAGDARIVSRLIGAHNVENLLVALGIAYALGLDVGRAADALSREPAPPGRLERCDGDGDSVMGLVDYAHTPDALTRVLGALRSVTPGRIWCVFGAGGDRDPTKRAPMGEAVARNADVAVVTSDNPRSEDPAVIAAAVVRGVRAAGREPVVELDRRKAIALAVDRAARGDVVLVAGKGHEDYQVIFNVKRAFDDRIELRQALEARRSRRGGA